MNSVVQRPLVSIIVRTKDRPKLLKNALKSIFEQTYRPIEVVLVNDGGCDLDIDLIKSILKDISLNYIRLEQNTGRAHAGNVGIMNTKGEYIGFLDDDDEFYPEHISVIIKLLMNIDYYIAYTDSEILYKKYNPEKQTLENTDRRIFSSKDFSCQYLFLENYIPLISILFSREIFSLVGNFDESLVIYEDWDLLIRCSQKYPFYHIKKVTNVYLQWSDTLQVAQSAEYNKLLENTYYQIISKHLGKFTPEVIRYFRDMINKIEAESLEKDLLMMRFKNEIAQKDEVLKKTMLELKETESYLNFIQSGRGWKMLTKYYYLRDNILKLLGIRK